MTDLEKLRAWAEPLMGPLSDNSLLDLYELIENAAAEAGAVPQYRRKMKHD